MKKVISLLLSAVLLFSLFSITATASGDESETLPDIIEDIDADSIEVNAKSVVLMDADTGTLLYTKNAAEALPPASVTKIMTLLLVAEALADGSIKLDDKVIVSSNAASMGGSQIFIKEGEEFTVEELLKSTVIASANDAAVALAELICGTEKAFVAKMNARAKELGMKNTKFENSTGLDDTVVEHLTSAYDIALMSRELIKHECVTEYSRVWQDSIRNGEFVLTNTNRLVRYYDGCTGLKTGSTDKAGFCVSATAKRDGMHLIAVVMGAESREDRNNTARALLDWGFANYSLYKEEEALLEKIPVLKGKADEIDAYSGEFSKLLNKSDKNKIEKIYDIPENLTAPISAGQKIGTVKYKIGDETVGESDIFVKESIEKIGVFDLYIRILKGILAGC